jgi:hypothetical protein
MKIYFLRNKAVPMRILLLGLCFFMNGPVTENAHDFHVSRSRIEYASSTQEWQITLHLFIDDLSQALEAKGKKELHLGTKKEVIQADAYLEEYLRRYFHLEEGDKPLVWEWIGKETTEDLTAFWIYLYVPNVPNPTQLTVENKLLLDLYDDQQNMVQVQGSNGKLRNFLFHQDYWQEEITLNQ